MRCHGTPTLILISDSWKDKNCGERREREAYIWNKFPSSLQPRWRRLSDNSSLWLLFAGLFQVFLTVASGQQEAALIGSVETPTVPQLYLQMWITNLDGSCKWENGCFCCRCDYLWPAGFYFIDWAYLCLCRWSSASLLLRPTLFISIFDSSWWNRGVSWRLTHFL